MTPPPLKADFTFAGRIERTAAAAARAEAQGADGVLVDEMRHDALAPHGEPAAVGRAVRERFGGLCTRVTVSLSHGTGDVLAWVRS